MPLHADRGRRVVTSGLLPWTAVKEAGVDGERRWYVYPLSHCKKDNGEFCVYFINAELRCFAPTAEEEVNGPKEKSAPCHIWTNSGHGKVSKVETRRFCLGGSAQRTP